jgi:AcrR family transcriptional regulator
VCLPGRPLTPGEMNPVTYKAAYSGRTHGFAPTDYVLLYRKGMLRHFHLFGGIKIDIRERIVKACRDLAAEQGLRRFTMDELAQRAGVSKRTVYRYFDSKESIIEASLEQFMSEAAARVEDLLAQNEQPAVFIQSMLNYLFSQTQFIINCIWHSKTADFAKRNGRDAKLSGSSIFV